jgi:hypothetical protein
VRGIEDMGDEGGVDLSGLYSQVEIAERDRMSKSGSREQHCRDAHGDCMECLPRSPESVVLRLQRALR